MKDPKAINSLPSFEELKRLASEDPKGLSQLRRSYCEDFISTVPSDHQHRLLCLQNRVELELQRAKNPISGIIMLSGMMQQSVEKLAEGFNQLNQPGNSDKSLDTGPANKDSNHTAEIISFQDYSSRQHH